MVCAANDLENLRNAELRAVYELNLAVTQALESHVAKPVFDRVLQTDAVVLARSPYPIGLLEQNQLRLQPPESQTKSFRVSNMRFADIIHSLNSGTPVAQCVDSILQGAFRLVPLIPGNPSVRKAVATQQQGSFTAAMHGKIDANGYEKLFSFASDQWYKIEIEVPNKLTLIVAIDKEREVLFLRLHPLQGQMPASDTEDSTDAALLLHKPVVYERLLIFNTGSRVRLNLYDDNSRQKAERQGKLKQFIEKFNQVTSSQPFLSNTPAGNKTFQFLHDSFKPVICVKHEETKNTLKYDAHIKHVHEFLTNMSKLKYAYACLASITAALIRAKVGYNTAGLETITWDQLVQLVYQRVEDEFKLLCHSYLESLHGPTAYGYTYTRIS